uniref:Uncharacterized protein n=1 Tax=Avena sativa TaxID=4498 RepID=A0ACD5ZR88_AVESA
MEKNYSMIRRSDRIASLHPAQGEGQHNELDPAALTRAQELKNRLGSVHPAFVKPLSHAYANTNSNLSIPTYFSHYLPAHNQEMVLEDEQNNHFTVLYYCKPRASHKRPLLSWWRGFADRHKLDEGDCLVFQLIETTKFKVYVVRASSHNNNDH